MELDLKTHLRVVLLGLVFLHTVVNCRKIGSGNDEEFTSYLKEAMKNYSTWLKKNDLDPSPLTSANMIRLKIYRGVQLECNISNHYMSGHSRPGEEETGSFNFASGTISVERIIPHLHEFQGDFMCSGVLRSYSFSELSEDLAFKGQGNFHISAYNAFESLSMRNVEITKDYKLDITNSFSNYKFQSRQDSVELNGIWDKALINNDYSELVREAFGYMHNRITTISDNHRSFPPGQLLDRYIRKLIKSVKIREDSDLVFGRYLNTTMNEYTSWLKEKELDPFQLKDGRMNGTHGRVQLDCALYKHYMREHSNNGQSPSGNSASNFAQHTFSMGRAIQNLYEFYGSFRCTGAFTAHHYDQWANDIMFNGHGEFLITSNYPFEFLTMHNVGIDTEYKLDFAHSTSTYLLPVTQMVSWLTGKWNETLLSKDSTHLDRVQEAFANIYKNFTEGDHPSEQLLKIYMRKATKRFNLRSIIDEEDLPSPFISTALPQPSQKSSTENTQSATTNQKRSAKRTAATRKKIFTKTSDITSFLRTIFYAVVFFFVSSHIFGKFPTIQFSICLTVFLLDRLL